MFTFILFVILALAFGIFATQNTQNVTVTLANYTLSQIPLYIVLGVSLLIGLSVSWINGLFNTFSATMKLRGKEHAIKDSKATIQQLNKKLDQLEAENARLRDDNKSKSQTINSQTSLSDRLKNMWPKN